MNVTRRLSKSQWSGLLEICIFFSVAVVVAAVFSNTAPLGRVERALKQFQTIAQPMITFFYKIVPD